MSDELMEQPAVTPPTAAPDAPKSIILFSDGTGNSSAKVFKTNVWRLYEAVDLGPPAAGKRAQISYYDDGVGTSAFQPLAMLGGAFGWGLKRNVLDIYRYACRNYRDGDEIYAFGFSRGAFTARLVVALIASEGLVRSSNEAELDRKSRAAYHSFRRAFLPRRLTWPTSLYRRFRRSVGAKIDRLKKRDPYRPEENCQPVIRFIGVWDTVSAYGGPITEITRAIDNWIYALSMPDYQLSERVLAARHALAIDDERDAFHPLLWDEVHEDALIKAQRVDPHRLEQVWFTGMHADVGGGYPDESLSYVSLLWMMEEAERAGLRTLKVIKDRIVALASSYGPIHDSRAGIGAYYRYQPRKIAAWLNPVDPRTLSLRDPAITDSTGKPQGLLRSVKVHESVVNRIATGTDRYAPITLPEIFAIVPPQAEGENVPQADNQTPDQSPETATVKPMISRGLRERLTNQTAAAARAVATEPIWNYVWWRRLTYFATLAATLALLLLPLMVHRLGPPPFLADGRTWIGGIIRLLTIALPSVAADWVEVYANNPFYFLVLVTVIGALLYVGKRLERRLRDEARAVWKRATEGAPLPQPADSWIQRFRNSRRYQRSTQVFKWSFLPDWVFAPAIVALLLWAGLAVYTQMTLPFLENGNTLCRSTSANVSDISHARGDFHTRDVCSGGFGFITQGERYIVTIDVVDAWFDSNTATSPEGISVGEFPWGRGYIAAPFRRVIDAHYLQPVLAVRRKETGRNFLTGNIQIYPLVVELVDHSATQYRGEFTAARTGELFLFANDAMIPLTASLWGKYGYRYFYEASGLGSGKHGNLGTACVTVDHVNAADQPLAAPPTGSICGRAADRDAALTATSVR